MYLYITLIEFLSSFWNFSSTLRGLYTHPFFV